MPYPFRSCLVAIFKISKYHIENKSYMHEVLNLDEIKNELYILLVN